MDGSTPGAVGTVSDSGWSNSQIFLDYLKHHFKLYVPRQNVLRGKIPVFLKADIRFSGVADFMYAAQASWHTSSFMMTVDVVLVFL
jgi:hypothetical protein